MDARTGTFAPGQRAGLKRISAAPRTGDGRTTREIAARAFAFCDGGPHARGSCRFTLGARRHRKVESLFCPETACGETQMFCETYDQSLKDAAATGEPLSPALRQHIASCDPCRTTFAKEQLLYAAIDSSVKVVANAHAPATLVPRVRVAIADEPQPKTFSIWLWVLAGGVVA